MPKAIKKKAVKKPRTDELNELAVIQKGLQEKRNFLVKLGAIALAVVIVFGGGYLYEKSRINRAAGLNYQGYKLYHDLYTKEPLTAAERMTKALDSFQKAYSIRKSAYSLFYMGNAQYELGKYQDAIKSLDELNRKYGGNPEYAPLARYKIALAYLSLGDKANALKYLDMISKGKTDSLKDVALYESARILDSEGKTADAAVRMGQLGGEFPGSPYAQAGALANTPSVALSNAPKK